MGQPVDRSRVAPPSPGPNVGVPRPESLSAPCTARSAVGANASQPASVAPSGSSPNRCPTVNLRLCRFQRAASRRGHGLASPTSSPSLPIGNTADSAHVMSQGPSGASRLRNRTAFEAIDRSQVRAFLLACRARLWRVPEVPTTVPRSHVVPWRKAISPLLRRPIKRSGAKRRSPIHSAG